jgi:hypothetical protein
MVRAPVFVVGLPKCGTTSIDRALRSAGWSPVHWKDQRGSLVSRTIIDSFEQGRSDFLNSLTCDSHGRPPNAVSQMDGFEIVEDSLVGGFPQITHLEQIVDAYEDALYILNFRNMDHWVRSITRWDGGNYLRLIQRWHEDLFGRSLQDLRTLIAEQEERCLRVFRDRDKLDQLLLLDIESPEASSQLACFLGVPRLDWSKLNASMF